IWTNLLTQCTLVPVSVFCCFCISGFSITKTVRKILEKIYKKSAFRNLPEPRSSAGGGPPGAEATWWRGPPPGGLLTPPFGVYLKHVSKPLGRELFSMIASLFR